MKKPRTPSRRAAAGRNPGPAAPAQRSPTYDDLLAIARLVESGSRFSEFRLRSGDIEVEVKRMNGEIGPRAIAAAAAPGATNPAAEIGPRPAAAGAAAGATSVPAGAHLVKSPMVGTFYRAAAPDAPPFVEVGSRVKPDTIVCIIEVMKLMNSVAAGVAGVVTHVLAENAQPVEFGQPMIAIKPE